VNCWVEGQDLKLFLPYCEKLKIFDPPFLSGNTRWSSQSQMCSVLSKIQFDSLTGLEELELHLKEDSLIEILKKISAITKFSRSIRLVKLVRLNKLKMPETQQLIYWLCKMPAYNIVI
jgi:hypothetical protein